MQGVDNSELVGLVMLDFKKACDMVDHNFLLKRLEVYGFHENALEWTSSYLMLEGFRKSR